MLNWFKTIFQRIFQWQKKSNSTRQTDNNLENTLGTYLNRPKYEVLTMEILQSINDKVIVETIFDFISLKLGSSNWNDQEAISSLNKYQQAIYLIWVLESEVNNGGFDQLYHNTSGQYYQLYPMALNLVGAKHFSEVVAKANSIFEANKDLIIVNWKGKSDKVDILARNDFFEDLDNEFFQTYQKEDLLALQIALIRNNPNHFTDI